VGQDALFTNLLLFQSQTVLSPDASSQKKFKQLSGEARAELLRKILAVSLFGVLI
jgi:hypothetical protein